jgi:2'-5' RNA ligase
VRLFVALDFPEAVRESLRELIARLKPLSRAARWVRPEGMHVTLKFIGETDSQKVVSLRVALGAIHSPQPVEMHFRGLGFFPNERKPRVLWCGVESSSNLAELAAAVERALVPFGFPPEGRDFMPHLTLARFPSPQGAAEIVRAAEELESCDFGSARETQFHLFESILKPSGAEYNRLASFAFAKGAE